MIPNFPEEILEQLRDTQVVAGFSIDNVAHAVPVAEALLSGGIHAIELTLRTPVAMEALRAICQEVPEMLVGVGTILTAEMAAEVKAAGADFGVAPGMNLRVVSEASAIGLPFAPGIATPSELENAIAHDCRFVKIFPAEPLGGVGYLRSMAAPYKHLGIEYFPLGGLNTENMLEYLNEANVPAIGGSWIVQESLVENEQWANIAERASLVRRILEGKAVTQNGAVVEQS